MSLSIVIIRIPYSSICDKFTKEYPSYVDPFPVPILQGDRKWTYIFIFALLCGASKGLLSPSENLFWHHKEVWNENSS